MKHLAIYGVCGGLLIVAMRVVEYRFLVLEHSFEVPFPTTDRLRRYFRVNASTRHRAISNPTARSG